MTWAIFARTLFSSIQFNYWYVCILINFVLRVALGASYFEWIANLWFSKIWKSVIQHLTSILDQNCDIPSWNFEEKLIIDKHGDRRQYQKRVWSFRLWQCFRLHDRQYKSSTDSLRCSKRQCLEDIKSVYVSRSRFWNLQSK